MKIVHSVDALGALAGSAVTIGNFDGVHLGHQALIRRTLEVSAQEGLTPVVMRVGVSAALTAGGFAGASASAASESRRDRE
jgi:FAD synthase